MARAFWNAEKIAVGAKNVLIFGVLFMHPDTQITQTNALAHIDALAESTFLCGRQQRSR
jgi:hypothetical protein